MDVTGLINNDASLSVQQWITTSAIYCWSPNNISRQNSPEIISWSGPQWYQLGTWCRVLLLKFLNWGRKFKREGIKVLQRYSSQYNDNLYCIGIRCIYGNTLLYITYYFRLVSQDNETNIFTISMIFIRRNGYTKSIYLYIYICTYHCINIQLTTGVTQYIMILFHFLYYQ